MKSFENKVVIVTGGAHGIGATIVSEFEKEGALVAFIDIANMVLYLASEKAGFITGENICIDGGMTRQMIYHNDCGWSFKG